MTQVVGPAGRDSSHRHGTRTEQRTEATLTGFVSAVVCTRDRGTRLLPTIESILASDHPDFELIVIDQSVDDTTEAAVAPFRDDRRFRYVRSSETGLGRSRNVGLELALGDVVAYTDDDVTVPPNWLREMQRVLVERSRVAVVFCNVAPADHDKRLGFIPAYMRTGENEVSTVFGKTTARGIGAGLAVRTDFARSIGGFDPLLGAGAQFRSCEDGDIALRSLLLGMHVCETDSVAVVHDGFRTWEEGRELTRRDWYGIGAAFSKPIRAGRWNASTVVLYEGIWQGFLRPLTMVFRGRRPQGLKRGWYFWSGFYAGIRTRVDRATLLFSPREYRSPQE